MYKTTSHIRAYHYTPIIQTIINKKKIEEGEKEPALVEFAGVVKAALEICLA